MKLRIAKLGYSRDPWRIVDENGVELSAPFAFDHHMLGRIRLVGPLCYPSKQAAIEGLGEIAGNLLSAAIAKREGPT
jgi:hypothetical protein